jgi:ferredoxin
MATVRVEAVEIKSFEAEEGRRLVLAIEDAGIDILHRCGGHARCTTCRVEVLEGDAGERTEREVTRLAREQDLAPNTRLSCQILVHAPLKVRVLRRLSETDMSDAGPRPDETIPNE